MTVGQKILLVCLLVLLLAIGLFSIKEKSLTYDEPENWGYGAKLLTLDSSKEYAGDMPFSALNALPLQAGKFFGGGKIGIVLSGKTAARLATILFSLLVAAFVFRWTKALYGVLPAFFSLVIYIVSPNLLAHSRLINTDFYAAGMYTIALFYFWRFLKFGGRRAAAASALTLGLSQLAKHSCLLLYPIFFMLVVVRYSREIGDYLRGRDFKAPARGARLFFLFGVFFLFCSLLVINLGFLWNESFTPIESYRFKSEIFRGIQGRLIGLGWLPVPLPYPYLEGIDWLIWKDASGDGFGYMYLFGRLKKVGGFRGYFLYAFLYKVPIAFQALLVFSAINYVSRRKKYNFRVDEAFLILPPIVLALYFHLFCGKQIGIRYILPVFPLLIIFCGSLFRGWPVFGKRSRFLLVGLLLYLAGSVISYFPHFLSYFNEFVWDRRKAYKIVADSNLDWGQNESYLERYVEEHPEVHVNPRFPVSGRIVVSVNDLVGVWEPGRYRWLRENFEPVGQIAYSYLIFEVPAGKLRELFPGLRPAVVR